MKQNETTCNQKCLQAVLIFLIVFDSSIFQFDIFQKRIEKKHIMYMMFSCEICQDYHFFFSICTLVTGSYIEATFNFSALATGLVSRVCHSQLPFLEQRKVAASLKLSCFVEFKNCVLKI